MTKNEIISLLRTLNKSARPDDITIYADAYLDYCEASENITKNGNIVSHPRTGSPIENPYIRVRVQAAGTIRKYKIRVGNLWDCADGSPEQTQ